eukprot:COSAG02_NODE_49_length_45106_cov_298.436177_14_plen_415_part_00
MGEQGNTSAGGPPETSQPVAPLVASDSWDDEWLEAEIARELAACEDLDLASTRPMSGTWMQGRAEARSRAREINDLPAFDHSANDSERPSKDDSRGQSRQDDAIDALVQYMQQRDAKTTAMETQMQDDFARVAQLAAGVEDGLDNPSQTKDAPSTHELVDQLDQLSRRSPTGRLATALEQARQDVDSDDKPDQSYEFGRVDELSREVLRRLQRHQQEQQAVTVGEGAGAPSDGGEASADDLDSEDFADFDVSATSSAPSSPNAAADELVERFDPHVPHWKVVEARQRQLQQEFRDTERKLIDFTGSLKEELSHDQLDTRARGGPAAVRGDGALWRLGSNDLGQSLNYCGDGVHRFAPPTFECLSGAASEIPEFPGDSGRQHTGSGTTRLARRTCAEQVRPLHFLAERHYCMSLF